MRRALVVANWKMHTDLSDANILATTVRNHLARISGIEVVLCPPSIWLTEVSQILGKKGKIGLGSQNIFYEADGPYTGEISPTMVKNVANYTIVGHSERRESFGETSLEVNEKTIAALRAGLSPIVCVGERRRSSKFPSAVIKELKEALAHIPKSSYKDIIVAYEPVWAISSTADSEGNADSEYVARVISALREVVLRDCPILYGGSVTSKNITEYSNRPEIDGVLVGSASLRASEFIKICQAWKNAKNLTR